MQRYILAASMLLGVLLLPANSVAAQQPTALTVSPAISEWIVKPGDSSTKSVMLTNTTDEPLPVKSVAKSLVVNEAIAPQDRHLFDASAWVTIHDPDFIVKPKEAREVSITVRVPKDALPGGHYATAYFNQLVMAPTQQEQTNVVGRVGALIFVTVAGELHKKLEPASSLTVQRRGSDLVLQVPLRNNGNVHVLPQVTYMVYDWRGAKVTTLTSPPNMILPKTVRTYETSWQPPVFGLFTVTAFVTYGADRPPISLRAQQMWLVPWHIVIPSVVLPLLAYFGVHRIRRRWMRAIAALRGR